MIRTLTLLALLMLPIGCGSLYQSPRVMDDSANVRVVPLTGESLLIANRSYYQPRTLPAIFSQTAGVSGVPRGTAVLPEIPTATLDNGLSAGAIRLPQAVDPGPYRIGLGDVLSITMASGINNGTDGVAQTNAYTVLDDGAIMVPGLGRVVVGGMTLLEADAELFDRMVENQLDPEFTLDVAEFNSTLVSIGGAVGTPSNIPITFAPLYLDQAIGQAGGLDVSNRETSVIRLYRNGTIYQFPLEDAFTSTNREQFRLSPGDSVFVDETNNLDEARDYFEGQIQIQQLQGSERQIAMQELTTQYNLLRSQMTDERESYRIQLELDAVDRDYVYLTGEVENQGRYTLPFNRTATLADALYDGADGIPLETGNIGQIYVLRASTDPREFGAVTAWHLNAANAGNLVLGTRFELRPDDVIFVAEQPVTRWARVIRQITPSLITTTVANVAN